MKRLKYFLIYFAAFLSCDDEQPIDNDSQFSLASVTVPLRTDNDLDTLLHEIGGSVYAMLGEASHGTSEFYTWRAALSKRLIEERGFNIIAVEGDWPALYKLNKYIHGSNIHGSSADQVLLSNDRWPTWMWANEEVVEFAEWLRVFNASVPVDNQVSFYGLDLYSLWESIESVLAYFETNDPAAAETARIALKCFQPYNRDPFAYAQAVSGSSSCAGALADMLAAVQVSADQIDENTFNALQNARTAVNAEKYYVTSTQSYSGSWNIRDRHMMQTINAVTDYHDNAKIIIWEHNTHVGDARATAMEDRGMVNVGQLVREEHESEGVYIIGFGTNNGTVLAASRWEGTMEEMEVPSAQAGSWEQLLHSQSAEDKIILLRGLRQTPAFEKPIGHRAIGVVYDPADENGNYVPSVLPERYDAFIFIDETHALHPLPVIRGRINTQSTLPSKFFSGAF
jgi:erythromycin esterase